MMFLHHVSVSSSNAKIISKYTPSCRNAVSQSDYNRIPTRLRSPPYYQNYQVLENDFTKFLSLSLFFLPLSHYSPYFTCSVTNSYYFYYFSFSASEEHFCSRVFHCVEFCMVCRKVSRSYFGFSHV